MRFLNLLSAIAFVACGAAAQVSPAATIAEGKKLFATSCSVGYCHGAEGRAGRGPRLRDREWDRGYLLKVIDDGVPNSSMPPWRGKLSEDQMQSVVAYILSISKEIVPAGSTAAPHAEQAVPQPAATQSAKAGVFGDPARGKALFFDATNDRNCGVCHQEGGAGGELAKVSALPAREILHRTLLGTSRSLELVMKDGEKTSGILADENTSRLRLYDLTSPGPPVLRSFNVADIVQRRTAADMVHDNFAGAYTVKQLLDIVSYLKTPAQVSLGELF